MKPLAFGHSCRLARLREHLGLPYQRCKIQVKPGGPLRLPPVSLTSLNFRIGDVGVWRVTPSGSAFHKKQDSPRYTKRLNATLNSSGYENASSRYRFSALRCRPIRTIFNRIDNGTRAHQDPGKEWIG